MFSAGSYPLSHSLMAISDPTTALPQAGSKPVLGLSSLASAQLLCKSLCCQALFKADQNAKPEAVGCHSGVLCQFQCNPCVSLPY